MTATVSLEIDTRPSDYTTPREFTGQLLDRQLHRPLFRETGQGVMPDLISPYDHCGSNEWVFRVSDDARWDEGEAVTAHDVADRLTRAVHLPQAAWARALISAFRVHDSSTFSVITRRKVSLLKEVLANPVFSPRRPGSSCGGYHLRQVQSNRAILVPNGWAHGSVIELVTTPSRDEGRRQFEDGRLDIGWGIGVPASFWSDNDPGPFPASQSLDMHMVVAAGRGVPQESVNELLAQCVLSNGIRFGLESTFTRFAIEPGPRPTARIATRATSERWPLYFTDFPPNHEIATDLATATGNRLVPTVIPYKELISNSGRSDGFSLQIHASHFPDDVGLLVESAVVANGSVPGTEQIRELCGVMWGAEASHERRHISNQIEPVLDSLLRRRVIGRMLTRFRSESPLDLPRSGWFDFSQLKPRETKG